MKSTWIQEVLRVVSLISVAILVTACAAPAPTLYTAVQRSDVPFAKELLASGIDANEKHSGSPMIYWAAQFGNSEMIRLLASKGAKVDEPGIGTELTPLAGLARHAKEPDELVAENKKTNEAVLKHYDEATARQNKWISPTDPAMFSTVADRAATLLELGADPNYVIALEWTPFLTAVENRNLTMVKAMLASKNKKVKTELRFHQWADKVALAALALQDQFNPGKGTYLTENGAEIAKYWQGVPSYDTALLYAAGKNDLELVKILVEGGANVNNGKKREEHTSVTIGDKIHTTSTYWIVGPLDIAVENGNQEMIEYLKSKGAIAGKSKAK
ncbi:MAG: hypothetical protein PXX77_09205 [Gallionella sp.]|nr:hypothetical protein [Gallionella sp.]